MVERGPRKHHAVSVYELAQIDIDDAHMPPPDLSTLLTDEEKAQPNKTLSPEEWKRRRLHNSGIVSVLELAQMGTDGVENLPPINLENLTYNESGDVVVKGDS